MELDINSLISDLALIMIIGAVTTVLFKWMKQPVVLGYIVAGFLVSSNFSLLPSITNSHNIEFWAQIGIIVLLFSLGLEFSFKKLVNAGGSAIMTALIIVLGMLISGFLVGRTLGFSDINCIFLGGMLSMSSTTIIIKAFTDLNLQRRKFASLVFAVLIVEDLFAVLMMVVLSSIAMHNSVEGGELVMSIGKLVFFLIIWFLVGIYVLPTIFNISRRFLNSETLLIVSMGLCLGMAIFSVACGFSMALGAFVMGSILAGTSFAERIEHVTQSVKDLFGAVFFISVGMMVNPSIIAQYWAPILILSALVIVGMIVFGTMGMLITGQNLRIAIESGFSLTQIGEFAFIIATLGLSLGVLDSTIYPIVVAVSVLTTFTTPYFIRLADPTYNFIERHLPERLHFLVERTSIAADDESEEKKLLKSILKRNFLRLILYTIVLVAISLVFNKMLLPFLDESFGVWGRIIGTTAALVVMSPFLAALMLPVEKKSEHDRLLANNTHFYLPLITLRVLRFIVAIFFIIMLLSYAYSLFASLFFGIVFFVIMAFLVTKDARKNVHRIEEHFLKNLNERDLRRTGRDNNLVADIHLAYVTIGNACPFIGQTLGASNLRRNFGINISSIQRGERRILIPGRNERLFPGDVIGVVGNDEQIQKVIPDLERSVDVPSNSLGDISLTSVHLSENSPIIGLTSASADLRGKYQALLVNIQRGNDYLAPDGKTPFEPNDVLWFVGDPKILSQLK